MSEISRALWVDVTLMATAAAGSIAVMSLNVAAGAAGLLAHFGARCVI
jgi:hypothetical protein